MSIFKAANAASLAVSPLASLAKPHADIGERSVNLGDQFSRLGQRVTRCRKGWLCLTRMPPFTAFTSFANPAVTIARSQSDTFAGSSWRSSSARQQRLS
jgi:hypothetical protein